MELNEIRAEIDKADEQLIEAFKKRMDCSKIVAEYKLENSLPIFDPEREQMILDKAAKKAGEYGDSARLLYSTIMELSRALQHDMLGSGEELHNTVLCARERVPFDSSGLRIVCFGIPGSYSHRAEKLLFSGKKPEFCSSFHDVFAALRNGEADFGIVPIENSSAGSVTDVYDLMLKYRFYIAAAIDVPIDHCLAAKKGSSNGNIHIVCSHSQALAQCSDFIRARGLEKREYISTAAAAEMVASCPDTDIAAICSQEAAEEYGLEILQRGFQNAPENTTRFIVISKELYIEKDSDKISLCFSLPHRTGSLYNILCRFAAEGLNLTKIESRPKSETPFEYMFYLDFTGNIRSGRTLALMRALSDELVDFSFLGNYREI